MTTWILSLKTLSSKYTLPPYYSRLIHEVGLVPTASDNWEFTVLSRPFLVGKTRSVLNWYTKVLKFYPYENPHEYLGPT
jgi:hypothetical protein